MPSNAHLPDPAARLRIAPQLENRWEAHRDNWQRCQNCPLCQHRRNVVLYRGSLPCHVLFIGEAPGITEDSNGFPFTGDAGLLLDQLIDEAWSRAAPANNDLDINKPLDWQDKHWADWGITNIVACVPLTIEQANLDGKSYDTSSGEIRPPTKEEASACSRRLTEIMTLAAPKLIVTLGDVARRFLPKFVGTAISGAPAYSTTAHVKLGGSPPYKVLPLIHPSAILRTEEEEPSRAVLLKKRFILNLSAALEQLTR